MSHVLGEKNAQRQGIPDHAHDEDHGREVGVEQAADDPGGDVFYGSHLILLVGAAVGEVQQLGDEDVHESDGRARRVGDGRRLLER